MNENKTNADMPEEGFEIRMEHILDMVKTHLYEKRSFDFYSDDTIHRMNNIEERIDNNTFLDKDFKVQFSNDFNSTINIASYEAFENGISVGLSLLKSLLGADVPKILIECVNPKKRPTRYTPFYDEPRSFLDFMGWASTRITAEEKSQLESKAQFFVEAHREHTSSLF